MVRNPVEKTNLPVGINRGHITKQRALPLKPVNRKGKSSASKALVKGIVREVAGFAPYERRIMELCVQIEVKNNAKETRLRNSMDKRARKLTKKRLGTLKRAKGKIEELSNIIAEQRRSGH